MKRLYAAAVLLFLLPLLATAQNLAPYSAVRIKSHGVSGGVIATGPNWSHILTCAHMFSAVRNPIPMRPHIISSKLVRKKMTFAMPHPAPGPVRKIKYKILAIDRTRDLVLIWISVGPLPYVTKIASAGTATNVRSVGFDFMGSLQMQRDSIRRVTPLWTFTGCSPRPGRSGGPLIDTRGELVGTCVGDNGRGIYTSLASVRQFMLASRNRLPVYDPDRDAQWAAPAAEAPRGPIVRQRQQYYVSPFSQSRSPRRC